MQPKKSWWRRLLGSTDEARRLALDILSCRYVREKQHAMRYRQHADRMRYPQFRDTLVDMAAEEEKHAGWIAEKITALGGLPPTVVPVHVANEANAWHYLRTDLEEEQRCAGELHRTLPGIGADFPELADLLELIEIDGKQHQARLRSMIARSDPQAVGARAVRGYAAVNP
jgi:rubrerythrin